MPISFRESDESVGKETVAYLRIVEDESKKEMRSGLFFVNALAEPVEFTFCSIQIPGSRLWRQIDAQRRAVRELCKSLFQASASTPAVLLCRAEEVPALVFSDDLHLNIPAARLSGDSSLPLAPTETEEAVAEATNFYWVSDIPNDESPARLLLKSLTDRSLVLEPFARARKGIEEAFTS